MTELQGQVAIVTGGASGIGAESCRVLARAGATVIVADVQDTLGTQVAGGMGPVGNYVHHDVTSEESWRSLLEGTLKRFGRLDVLVNNAGISGGMGSIEDTTLETWQHVHAVNSDGVFLGCKIAVEGMQVTSVPKPAIKGSIVNISSIAGIIGSAGPCAYTASKGAVRLLSKSVALYCAGRGWDIRCNSIHPGGTDTPIFAKLWDLIGEAQGKAMIGSVHPVGHMGRPADIAEAVLYLASDRSAFVTGAEIVPDGGITAGFQRRTLIGPR
jgi:3(or 17)beta-hydroxysteroid dehydrogenase